MMSIHTSPGLEDLWQFISRSCRARSTRSRGCHRHLLDEPSAAMPIAPIAAPAAGRPMRARPVHNGKAYWIKVSARTDGTFTVTNQRNGFSKTYAAPGS